MSTPRVTLIDIETTPNLGWTWGKWEQDVIRFKIEWQVLCFAYKELGEKAVRCVARPQFKDKTDRSVVKAAWDVLNESDVIIGHNVDRFDNRKLRAKFIEHDLPPPRPYKTIDTLKIARAQFAFNSNKLDDLARTLKIGKKAKTGGVDTWFGCMEGDPEAWATMIKYNIQDVILLESVYDRVKSWHPSHPNLAMYTDRPGCPVCKSSRVQRRGVQILRSTKKARFQCQNCAHWFSQKLED